MKTLIHNEIIPDDKTCVAIGNFDGVHLGHLKLIEHMMTCAKDKNIPSVVYTFIGNDKGMNKIYSQDNKIKIFEQINPCYLYFEEFSKQFMSMSAEEFVESVLVTKLKAVHIVVGENFRFGKNASCDANDLRQICSIYGITVDILPILSVDGEAVSSTLLRKILEEGNVKKFTALTGRNYCVSGAVVKGKQLGRKLGFPTANIIPDKELQPLKNGVYSTVAVLSGVEYKSLTNVGVNPSVGGEEKHIETYIDGFCDDIYGEVIEIRFIDFIRNECKFSSVDELKRQIRIDCKISLNE